MVGYSQCMAPVHRGRGGAAASTRWDHGRAVDQPSRLIRRDVYILSGASS